MLFTFTSHMRFYLCSPWPNRTSAFNGWNQCSSTKNQCKIFFLFFHIIFMFKLLFSCMMKSLFFWINMLLSYWQPAWLYLYHSQFWFVPLKSDLKERNGPSNCSCLSFNVCRRRWNHSCNIPGDDSTPCFL